MACTDPVDPDYRYYTREITKKHRGIDIVGKEKDYIKSKNAIAVGKGKVVAVKDRGDKSYGKVVMIDHGNNYISVYAHLESYSVKKADSVTAGKVIGKIDNTGKSSGHHLHFEIREYKELSKVQSYEGVINNSTPVSPFDNCLDKKDYKKQSGAEGGPAGDGSGDGSGGWFW
jgi:murein DD-endopeptidase MepM/ murein hydrolase activator NlpD